MAKTKYLTLVPIPILLALAIIYRGEIDMFFETTSASNYLLVALIIVEVSISFILREMNQRESQERDEAIFFKEILEQWDAHSHLARAIYYRGTVSENEPSDPEKFLNLPPKAQERFKTKFSELWKAWEALKAKSKQMNDRLNALYQSFHGKVEAVRDSWIKEMADNGSPFHEYGEDSSIPGRYTLVNLRGETYEEVYVRAKSNLKYAFNIKASGEYFVLARSQEIAVGNLKELESLKTRLETLVDSDDNKDLAENIVKLENEINELEAVRDFQEMVRHEIRNIEWQYLLGEKPATHVPSF